LAVCIVSFNLQAATPEQNMFDDLYLRISPHNQLLGHKKSGHRKREVVLAWRKYCTPLENLVK